MQGGCMGNHREIFRLLLLIGMAACFCTSERICADVRLHSEQGRLFGGLLFVDMATDAVLSTSQRAEIDRALKRRANGAIDTSVLSALQTRFPPLRGLVEQRGVHGGRRLFVSYDAPLLHLILSSGQHLVWCMGTVTGSCASDSSFSETLVASLPTVTIDLQHFDVANQREFASWVDGREPAFWSHYRVTWRGPQHIQVEPIAFPGMTFVVTAERPLNHEFETCVQKVAARCAQMNRTDQVIDARFAGQLVLLKQGGEK